MKKTISVALALITALGIFSFTALAADTISIKLDGKTVTAEVPPFTDANGRTMVPVRLISEALGANVGWEGNTRTVTVTRGPTVIELQIDSPRITTNGATAAMDTAAVIKDDRTFVPVRYIAEALGLNVGWDAASKTVVLTSAGASGSAQMYSDWPTVPDYGVLTGATLDTRSGLDGGGALYNYNVQSAPEGSITAYGDILKENGFSFVTAYEVDGNTRLMYNKGDVYVSIGVQPKYIVVLIREKS